MLFVFKKNRTQRNAHVSYGYYKIPK